MRERVLIYRCGGYEPERIARIIGDGMDELGIVPRGRVLVKPNLVIAHRRYFPYAFTRAEFVDGLLAAVKARGAQIEELAVGERSGITLPTRFAFAEAGYPEVVRRHGVKRYFFDECFQVERRLHHPRRLRDTIFIPEPIDACDFLINAPKLKTHTWTRITVALKNFIGLQDDKHRLIDHDYGLEHKIADLQEVIQPSLVAVDAIVAGEGKMLTPVPFPLGAVILGTNPVAVDAVVCQLIGFDPRQVTHLRLCHERGYGPLDPEAIELGGDFPFDEIHAIASRMRVPTEKVDAVLNGKSRLTAHVGPPPDPAVDYCWGGCPGSLIEAMEIVQMMQPDVYREVRPMHFVFGRNQGTLEVGANERVVICGDCASFSGIIGGRPVEIPSRYVPREAKDPRHARARGLIMRIVSFLLYIIGHRRSQVLRAKGCPVSVPENVLFLWKPGGTKNPYFDARLVFPFFYNYCVSKLVKMVHFLFHRRPRPRGSRVELPAGSAEAQPPPPALAAAAVADEPAPTAEEHPPAQP